LEEVLKSYHRVPLDAEHGKLQMHGLYSTVCLSEHPGLSSICPTSLANGLCCSNTYAVLEEPAPAMPVQQKGKKKKKEDPRVAAAQAAAVADAMAAATVVRIKSLDGMQVKVSQSV
jgi:hypothetical protein